MGHNRERVIVGRELDKADTIRNWKAGDFALGAEGQKRQRRHTPEPDGFIIASAGQGIAALGEIERANSSPMQCDCAQGFSEVRRVPELDCAKGTG